MEDKVSRSLEPGKPWATVRNIGGALYVFGAYATWEESERAIAERPNPRIKMFSVYVPDLDMQGSGEAAIEE